MKKLLTSLFVITTVIFVVLFLLKSNNASKYQNQTNQLKQKLEEKIQQISEEKSNFTKLKKSIKEYKTEIVDLKKSSEKLVSRIEQQTVEESEEKPEDMMESPEMQEAMRMQLKNSIALSYNFLIKELDLNETDAEAFCNLLTDELMIGAKSAKGILNVENDKRKEFADNIYKERMELDSMIKELLGEENYGKYTTFKEKQTERNACVKFNQQLPMSGEKLTPEQSKQLIDIMYDERINSQNSPDFFKFNKETVANYNEEAEQKSIQLQRATDTIILDRAKKLLNEKQYEAFELYIFSLQPQKEAQIKMMMKMIKKFKK